MLLADILEESARAHPHDVAVLHGDAAYTYEHVWRRVCRLADTWRCLGVGKGEHVALISENSPAFLEVLFSCAQVGAVCENFNVRLSAVAIVGLLAQSNARVVVLSPAMYEQLVDHLCEVDRPLTVLLLGKDGCLPDAALSGDAARGGDLAASCFGAQSGAVALASVQPADPVLMLYTSGTTGLPKGVVFSHEALLRRTEIDVEGMRFSAEDIMLFVLPFFHVTCVSVLAVLRVGACMVIGSSNKPADVVSLVNRHQVTRIGLVPYHLRVLADYLEATGARLDSLRLVIYGAEPADSTLLSRCQALLGCGFLQGYGMTETSSSVTVLLPEHHSDPRLLKTAGLPLPGIEVRVLDKQGNECPPGESGEIAVRTRALMTEYWQDARQTACVLQDGWYHTADVGFLDEQGFLTLVDRKDNMVITGGENVYPAEVARCIAGMDGVADVVVTGVPDAHWGESLVAFVVRASGIAFPTEADVTNLCADQLGNYKKPRQVVFVDSLRRKASGKVPKDRLQELIEAHVIRKDDHGRL